MTMSVFNVRQFFSVLFRSYAISLPAIHLSRTQKVSVNYWLSEVRVNIVIICTGPLHNNVKSSCDSQMEISLSQSEFISHELITLAVRVSLRFSLFASLVVQSYWEDWHNS
jgi:hypothetical protein